ncbi:HAD family phosphatase [Fulvivirga sp. M361]|uniref:HAD family hydrolase n=1 Tax=Fulvivirga sp. M361 TaxID=2594266 RepID=UPI00117A2D2C|nr:HAD family phosphatase [Fulvivirga sp. M361]TRX62664.1 HAD family phosphatase [Fulvivirga sp. M361]
MKIDNIIFDFGGVLVDWNPRYLFDSLFEDKEALEYFLSEVCTHDWNIQQDAGRSLAEGTRLLQEIHPEHATMIQRFYDDWEVMLKDEIVENTKLIPVLKRSYRLFGLTNWSAETFPIALKRFPFFSELEGIVVSGEEKMIKPNKEIYLLLLDRYKLKAENSIFIDDNLENILAAQKIGFHTVHFNGDLNLEHELERIGVL